MKIYKKQKNVEKSETQQNHHISHRRTTSKTQHKKKIIQTHIHKVKTQKIKRKTIGKPFKTIEQFRNTS